MRILTVGNMYPPHHLGGYELMWRSSVGQLRAAGHEVRVVTTDYRGADTDAATTEDPDVHRELRWYWRRHRWPRLSPWERWRMERHNQRTFERHLRDFRPDAVAWWAMGGMSLSLIERSVRRGTPGAGVVVDDWLLYGPREDQWQRMLRRLGPARGVVGLLARVPSRLRFDAALEWVLVSQAIRGHAQSAGWALPHSTVVHAGVDLGLFRAAVPGPWRGRLLCVGRLDPRKGVHTAIAALAELPASTLTILGSGDGDYLLALQRQVHELGLSDRVSFDVRSRSELPTAYAESDAVLFPVNWEEPFGLVPLEAMAVGRPVVASGTGGSAEYLSDGDNCLLYGPPEDPSALAAAVRRLAEGEGLRDRIRGGGTATAARLDEQSFNRQVEAALIRAAQR